MDLYLIWRKTQKVNKKRNFNFARGKKTSFMNNSEISADEIKSFWGIIPDFYLIFFIMIEAHIWISAKYIVSLNLLCIISSIKKKFTNYL